MLYSISWEKELPPKKTFEPHIIRIKTKFLDESGHIQEVSRKYEEWLGVCTNHIEKVVEAIRKNFPNCPIHYTYLGPSRKILPYFETRLRSGKLDSSPKPFYKVYVKASVADVGRFFNQYKISYYGKDDWLVRLYIDLCTKYDSTGFYYKWYTISEGEWLMDTFQMHPEQTRSPDWTIGAFDLETVPMDGTDHIPNGLEKTDEIVMISLYKWNTRDGLRKWLLYRGPNIPMEDAYAYSTERQLLQEFHTLIQDCHVLTGYNINGFDFPCLFARLLWLKMGSILKHYSSLSVGRTLVTTYQKKLVLDLYNYFLVFSKYDLPGFKLDDVARAKLDETKVPIHSTGLWAYYTHPDVTPVLLLSENVEECYKMLKPRRLHLNQFGTFKEYMHYCLKDSFLVYRLFTKEMVLSFLVERANFTAWDATQALHMGNSRFLLELFKTYGTRLGYFVNARFLSSGCTNKYKPLMIPKTKTYQGALNFCFPQQVYENVSIMDFASMYPSALLSCNLCYSTCSILTREEWLQSPRAQELLSIPYRIHGDQDFLSDVPPQETFQYPAYDPNVDAYVIVANTQTEAFLPCIVKHFIDLRKIHQRQYKLTKDVYHHNVQLCIKILINSLYGVMANKESCLAYLPIAMIIVTLARYQLLGSYHYLKQLGYRVCYADTDSLMVEKWPKDDCVDVNCFLNLPHVELKYEERVKRLLVLSRKRYIYQSLDGEIKAKCFQKRVNELAEFITDLVLDNIWSFIYSTELPNRTFQPENIPSNTWMEDGISTKSRGWLLWAEIIQKAHYKCRDPKRYSILRKTKNLCEYKSEKNAAVRMLQKYPEKANDFIEYTYSRADVSQSQASSWVMDAKDCQWVDYEQMFISHKKTFCTLLNMAFWQETKTPMTECDMMMNTYRWKQFTHAELLYYHTHKRKIVLLVEKGTRYTFSINENLKKPGRVVHKPNKQKKLKHQ